MIVMLIGWIAPAPMPCTARNTMSVSMLHANPHSTDPAGTRRDPRRTSPAGADHVGELAVQRRRHRLGQQVHREQPRELREPPRSRDHRRHRGRDDGAVERRRGGGQHHRGEPVHPLGPQPHRFPAVKVAYLMPATPCDRRPPGRSARRPCTGSSSHGYRRHGRRRSRDPGAADDPQPATAITASIGRVPTAGGSASSYGMNSGRARLPRPRH